MARFAHLTPPPLWALPLLLSFASVLSGCAGGNFATTAEPATEPVLANIGGRVHGGALPVQGGNVILWETQSNGYGGAAKQLLSTTTDSGGNFTFSSYFTCDSGQFAYLTATGGHTLPSASAINNNMIQVAVLGPCSNFNTNAQQDATNVWISELSTVAAAYALGNFITISGPPGAQLVNISAPANNNAVTPSCSGSGSSLTCTASGLAHAFTTTYNLVDSVHTDGSLPTGAARTASPTNTYSLVPQSLINTIGNVLQSCVDSAGGTVNDGSACGTLFHYATPPDNLGSAPTNTLQAALNMARYPTNNVNQLFGLQPKYTFFSPSLTIAPTAFTLSIFYGVNAAGQHNISSLAGLALDQTDTVYTVGGTASAFVRSWNPDGSDNFTSAAFGSNAPLGMAIDAKGDLYAADAAGNVLSANTAGSTFTTAISLTGAKAVAFDRSGNLWSAASGTRSIQMYNSSALLSLKAGNLSVVTPSYASGLLATAKYIAVDANQDIWAVAPASSGTNTAVLTLNGGSLASPSYTSSSTIALSTFGSGASVAVDSNSSAYFPLSNNLNVVTLSSTVSNLLSSTGSTLAAGSQVDGSNTLFWANNDVNGAVMIFAPGGNFLSSFDLCLPNPVTGSCMSPADILVNPLTPQYMKGLGISSSGDIWMTSSGTYPEVIQLLGVAQPSWPLLSYGRPGVLPQ